MIHGKKKSYNGTLYIKKTHFCPDCKTPMIPISVSKVAHNSQEARRYNRGNGRNLHFAGNVEYSWYELKCPSCTRQITIEEMQKIEFEQMTDDEKKTHERKEKLKIAAFKGFLLLGVALLIIGYVLFR